MTDATFEKISRSETPLYGPRKLLLCGFSAAAHPKFEKVLTIIGLADVPTVWAAQSQAETRLDALFDLADGSGRGISSPLARAIIAAGILEKELHLLMEACRQTGMQQALWATLTPVSETWTLKQLLDELAAERRALNGRQG